MSENYIVFPEGDSQEIDDELPFGALVDLNGVILNLPLPSPRMIVYRVFKIRREEGKGRRSSFHYLELLPASELLAYISPHWKA